MVPLMEALAARRPGARLIAPDTLGNGDSAAPAPQTPDVPYFADALARLLDAMGVTQIDLYGSHTGARVATEFAAAYPARVRRLVLDGIVDYPDELKKQILANYAPDIRPDDYGRQLIWAFNFTRDQNLYSPYFMRNAENRLNVSMASAEELHLRTVDILKALRTYHKPYLAAFRYVARDRIPLVKAPTLMITVPTDSPALRAGAAELVKLLPDGRHREIAVGVDVKAAEIAAFLQ
jgi:pimeloyl-ACP methyl ester carboxylesterase